MASASPAAGYTSVASTVTITGPTTKIISSLTDSKANAVCSRGESPSSALQRARTIEPSEGIDAPAATPDSTSAHTGARNSAQPMKMIVLSAKIRASGLSTRCWPNRSASLAACGAQTA